MSSALNHEDLENVALVRMEDVQPSRDRIDRSVNIQIAPAHQEIYVYKYDDHFQVDDDSDSNIGSMVSIQSEEFLVEEEIKEEVEEEEEEEEEEEVEQEQEEEEQDSDSGEQIEAEVLQPPIEINVPAKLTEIKTNQSDSWPTLEILPGGVIKNADVEILPTTTETKAPEQGEMTYACAKCSQTFKYLFCLVKHVKWHEDQNKVAPHLRKLSPLEKELILIKKERSEVDKNYKIQKVEVLARIATAIGKMNNANI